MPSNSSKSKPSRGNRFAPRLYRLVLLVALIVLLQRSGAQLGPPDSVTLADAKTFFADAARLGPGDRRLGGQTVYSSAGKRLGLVLTTSPHTDDVVGYAGPSNLLIAVDEGQRLLGVSLLSSGDTQAHVRQVRDERTFWAQFTGRRALESPSKIEAVSGSTLTSLAMAEAIEKRLGGTGVSLRFPDEVTLAEVQQLFPDAETIETEVPPRGWVRVRDGKSMLLGFAARTSPYSDNGRGYRGPTESLLAIGADGQTVTRVRLRKSYDTPDYVDRVRDDEDFLKQLAGRTIDDWAGIDFHREGIEGVSGATQTSFAVAEGVKRRLGADREARLQPESARWNLALVAVIGGALVLTFSPLRASRRLTFVWNVVLVVVFLFILGDLLSVALLAGWSRHGLPWKSAPAVVMLAAVALCVPWATRRQVYCQSICPHGAAQTLLGRFKSLHVRLPPAVLARLTWLRPVALAAAIAIAVSWPAFDLAQLEPFDGWVLKSAAAVSAVLAIVGLVAALFVPQAYCRFGCPTGELLARVRSGGSHDKIGRREWLAGGLVLAGLVAVHWPHSEASTVSRPQEDENTREFRGRGFGTTWSVKVRGQHDVEVLTNVVSSEVERIESALSHWRADSATAQFNASETTLATEQPQELIALVARALELSEKSAGAYDITVAPLVEAWGFGPAGEIQKLPTDAQIRELLDRTGWQKLEVDREAGTLRKLHPQLEIDLGSLLQGYAADRVSKLLAEAGVAEFLVNVGGEMYAQGEWTIAIEDPQNPSQPLRKLQLANAGLATSGLYRASKPIDGETVHHLISPQSGRPVAMTTQLVAVVAPTALAADGWSTALFLVGSNQALDLAREQGLEALIVEQNDELLESAPDGAAFGSR